MAHIYKYAILQAVPDPRRGERVNIGIVIFLADRLDIRFSEVAKVRALTGHDWTAYIAAATDRLQGSFVAGEEPSSIADRFALLDRAVALSDAAWFSTANSDYEERVDEILQALVLRPRAERKASAATRLNTEIASEFKAKKALATPDEGIGAHKIVRHFEISREEKLVADFALRNSVYHVAATLDLRKANPEIEEACLKAVVLAKAEAVFGKKTQCFGVIAAEPSEVKKSPQVKILSDYADNIFNWVSANDRRVFAKKMYDAMHPREDFKLK